MCFKNVCLWHVMICLGAFVCGALGQTLPSANDMTSDMTSDMVTHWTKCAPTTDDNKLRSIALIPFHLCQKECGLRTRCVGVNYWPRGKVCDLLSSISGLETNVLYGKPCIHVAATNPEKCDCSANEVCEPETGSCAVQECPVPHVSKATLLGNMNVVGSKVKVVCASGYDVELSMVCEDAGNWSNNVFCAINSDVAPTNNVTDYVTDYVTVGCQILKFSTYAANHSDAQSACAPYGNLVRIDSAEKQAAIKDFVIAHESLPDYGYWIQGTLDVADGIWKYDDGSPMVYTNWVHNAPNGPDDAYCVRMTTAYRWNDRQCWWSSFRFICELLE